MRAVIKRRGAAVVKVSEDDVLRAIEKLLVLGGGCSALNVGGRVVVRSGSFVHSFIHSFCRRAGPIQYCTTSPFARCAPFLEDGLFLSRANFCDSLPDLDASQLRLTRITALRNDPRQSRRSSTPTRAR